MLRRATNSQAAILIETMRKKLWRFYKIKRVDFTFKKARLLNQRRINKKVLSLLIMMIQLEIKNSNQAILLVNQRFRKLERIQKMMTRVMKKMIKFMTWKRIQTRQALFWMKKTQKIRSVIPIWTCLFPLSLNRSPQVLLSLGKVLLLDLKRKCI